MMPPLRKRRIGADRDTTFSREGRRPATARRRRPSYRLSCTEVVRALPCSHLVGPAMRVVTAGREGLRTLDSSELLRRHHEAPDPILVEELVRRYEPLARSVARR